MYIYINILYKKNEMHVYLLQCLCPNWFNVMKVGRNLPSLFYGIYNMVHIMFSGTRP